MQRRASMVLLAVLCLGLRSSSPAQIPKIDLKSLKSVPGLAGILTAGLLEFCRKSWLSAVVGGIGNLPNPPVFDPAEDPQPSRSGEQPNGGSGRGTDQVDECQRQYDGCMEKAQKDLDERIKNCPKRESFDRNLCDSGAIAKCLMEIYSRKRDGSTLKDFFMDACRGGAAYECVRKAAASFFIRAMQCEEAFKKCLGI
jgi:hypothetical protein